jgi:predicted transcriptional regulator
MNGKKLIRYEATHYKLTWKYKSLLKDDFTIINVSEIEREINYCYDSTQYIMAFIDILKHRVIRLLPDLNKVEISIGVFDKDNVLHRLMVGAYYVLCNMLRKEVKKKNFYKTIFTIIRYEDNIVFMGNISFDGIK